MLDRHSLKAGDRVKLSGGYDNALWLCGRSHVLGIVDALIPGQNDQPAVVVRLDEPIEFDGIRGSLVVLELRYVGATWGPTGTVHVELCDFNPENKRWQDRRQGKWVESHATYELTTEAVA